MLPVYKMIAPIMDGFIGAVLTSALLLSGIPAVVISTYFIGIIPE